MDETTGLDTEVTSKFSTTSEDPPDVGGAISTTLLIEISVGVIIVLIFIAAVALWVCLCLKAKKHRQKKMGLEIAPERHSQSIYESIPSSSLNTLSLPSNSDILVQCARNEPQVQAIYALPMNIRPHDEEIKTDQNPAYRGSNHHQVGRVSSYISYV